MRPETPSPVQTPSGKDEAYENFPVGSWLLPAKLRPHIAAFYSFARTIDDIADSPDLEPEEKLSLLIRFEAALAGDEAGNPDLAKAHRMRESLAITGITARHCTDLIAAFKQDAIKNRYDDWDDLMGYCQLSAVPVGRYLLDLHGGSRHGYAPSDALCKALQVINHLQDCQDDFRTINRVYLPADWMDEEGVNVSDLDRAASTPGLRRVLDRALDHTDDLLIQAAQLPDGLSSRRLALESAFIINIALKLVELLRRQDPLSSRVVLSKSQYLWCGLRGVFGRLF